MKVFTVWEADSLPELDPFSLSCFVYHGEEEGNKENRAEIIEQQELQGRRCTAGPSGKTVGSGGREKTIRADARGAHPPGGVRNA